MTEPSEPTGQHALPPAAAGLPTMIPPAPNASSKVLAVILSAVLAVISGAGSGYATSAARDAAESARTDQRVTEAERRITVLEQQLGGVEGLRREVASLSATVIAQNAALQQRLQRIEDSIDRRGP